MHINMRVVCRDDVKRLLAQDRVVSSNYKVEAPFFINSTSEVLDRVLEVTKDSTGLCLTSEVKFTQLELGSFDYFQIVCKKTLKESKLDYSFNLSHLNNLDLIPTGEKTKVRLMKKIALSRIDLKPNEIAGLDQWAEEYIIPQAVKLAFHKWDLTGLSAVPIMNPKTKEDYPDYHQLYTESFMPPALASPMIVVIKSPNPKEQGIRQLGCLAYDFDDFGNVADFNRTAEAYNLNDIPDWVISKGVVTCYKGSKLKGWSFRPVFNKDHVLYSEYLDIWAQLSEKISINPSNRFC